VLVASTQLAITIGASGGDAIYDFKGATTVFGASSVALFADAVMALFAVPTRTDEASCGHRQRSRHGARQLYVVSLRSSAPPPLLPRTWQAARAAVASAGISGLRVA
jgi:hypothetical protein